MSSTEKTKLLEDLAESFVEAQRNCYREKYQVRIQGEASGTTLTALAAGLAAGAGSATDLPEVWSPASSVWYRLLEQRTHRSERQLFAEVRTAITQTPLVLAIPTPIAEELTRTGPLTWARVLELTKNPTAWQDVSKGRWGPFTLGKTNPNVSTSGLNSLLAADAALSTQNQGKVSEADTQDVALRDNLTALELATIHYGETTLDYLCDLAAVVEVSAAEAFKYATVVLAEEKSVYDHNIGNRDWCDHKNEPEVKLVPVPPADGTIMSDSPFGVLAGATPDQVALANEFHAWLSDRAQQKRFTDEGFRGLDGTLDEAVARKLQVASSPLQTFVQVPDGRVIDAVLALWEEIRKPARVLLVVDTSTSMGFGMTSDEKAKKGQDSRLDVAKRALIAALDDISVRDKVGLWTFSGDSTSKDLPYRKVVSPGLIGETRAALTSGIQNMHPTGATALYKTIAAAHGSLKDDPIGEPHIQAVIVLTDGFDEYQGGKYTKRQLLRAVNASGVKDPVRVFTIAYGANEEIVGQLADIASVSGGGNSSAKDRSTIQKVLLKVISNF